LHTDFHSPCSDEGPEDIYDDTSAVVDEMTVSDLYEELVSESTDNTIAILLRVGGLQNDEKGRYCSTWH